MIRWYPPNWRARYGDEFAALLHDTHGMNAVRLKDRIAVARAGLTERAREEGLIGDSSSPSKRIRTGSLLILFAWSFFMVAGAFFAKFSDRWDLGSLKQHSISNVSYGAVQWAGLIGMAILVVAALVVFPASVRFVRSGGWPEVKRPVVRAAVVGLAALGLTVGGSIWAHHLTSHDRNGGSSAYVAFFVILVVAILAFVIFGTAAALSVARRLRLTDVTNRALGLLAVALTALMAVVFVGTITWWGAEASYDPKFLGNGLGGGLLFTSSTAPLTLIVAGVLMFLGFTLAMFGAVKVARSMAPDGNQLSSGSNS